MDSANKKISDYQVDLKEKNTEIIHKKTGKFDMSLLGKIDLAEAEKIANEEVIFLTEDDLIEGLEDFELIPIRNQTNKLDILKKNDNTQTVNLFLNEEESSKNTIPDLKENEHPDLSNSLQSQNIIDNIDSSVDVSSDIEVNLIEDYDLDQIQTETNPKENDFDQAIYTSADTDSPVPDDIIDLNTVKSEVIYEITDELPISKKLFSVKINEETLDAQLLSVLNSEEIYKSDEKISEKYTDQSSNLIYRFVDDQFLNKIIPEDTASYNEDLLTERLVKMIDVANGRVEILDKIAKENEFFKYILEDYTLYNSEKFDSALKEEIFYSDSDFEFIDNAIIRDDFTKYIHEIDDYFQSADSLAQSEISEILGLVPEENDYIDDKLFGNYYKKYDLDNEIEFIKPEIDFFRSNYSGIKSLNYFTENENSLLDSEKSSIEEDISSANAIVFEEDISEIEFILRRDYDAFQDKKNDKFIEEKEKSKTEEVINITDKIIILEDKEKIMELASEFPDKNENLVKLLSYLDGLFEKLPEDVIRKFAESEYFELYSKVLKEMGV